MIIKSSQQNIHETEGQPFVIRIGSLAGLQSAGCKLDFLGEIRHNATTYPEVVTLCLNEHDENIA